MLLAERPRLEVPVRHNSFRDVYLFFSLIIAFLSPLLGPHQVTTTFVE